MTMMWIVMMVNKILIRTVIMKMIQNEVLLFHQGDKHGSLEPRPSLSGRNAANKDFFETFILEGAQKGPCNSHY